MEHLSNNHEDHPNHYENSQTMRWNRASCCEFDGKSMETETWSEFSNGGKAIVEQILASEERNKSKRAGLWESVWNLGRKVKHLSKVIWDRKITTEFTKSISSTWVGVQQGQSYLKGKSCFFSLWLASLLVMVSQ